MDNKKEAIKALAREAALHPQEEMLAVDRKRQQLTVGIPRETSFQEKRVALTPDAVKLLVANGHEVLVETLAGIDCKFDDREYSEAGAQIVYGPEEVFKANIVFKVAPPTLEEVKYMPGKQTLFSALQLTTQPVETLKMLISKRITAIAWDYIKDETGIYSVVRAMGEIAGNTAVQIAGEYLSNTTGGLGLMFGGISGVKPLEVVILGAGTVGEFAARASLGLGASLKVFDDSMYKLRRLQNDLGQRLWTSTINPELLKTALATADVVIGAMRAPFGRTPCVVSEDMVRSMKSGAVVVDVSIDQGGCVETSKVTTHDAPTYRVHDVIHYCVPNIASRVSRTASYALSNIFTPILLFTGEAGGIAGVIKNDVGLRNGVYLYNGTLTNEIIGEAFDLPYKDLNLLIAAL
ncbi:MAG: alanine dehydrogenase [Flavobacteriales bacterium]|nr:alanine dehydrogenase [Flavobacteriales bacterium]